jgi:formiminotetrahydrofolate cyclodeaminase
LVEMVVNLTLGKAGYAQHAEHVTPVGVQAAAARSRALELAAADEEAFEAVMAAYRLPRDTDAAKATRKAAVQTATAAAAQPPMAVAELAALVITLAAALPGRSNPNVLSDVGVAASLAVSALESSAINVEVNLGALAAGPVRDDLRTRLAGHLAAVEKGRQVVQDVRDALSS